MGARAKMLVSAVRDIMEELPNALVHLPEFFLELVQTVILPALIGLVILTSLWDFGRKVYYKINPKSAKRLHAEALGCLKQGDSDQMSIEEATSLLEQSIGRDKSYLPSYLSLATIQLYQLQDPDQAQGTVNRAKRHVVENKSNRMELEKLETDIRAMQHNPEMARIGAFGNPHLGAAGLQAR